ncbi:MAG: type II toxin-antitoxin system RelE/ParE family toxin [Parcubacteria group bacterium]|nr:type II toxin-antitoxin system RelE/ParE family toxin [Parcubacteria group bacterium]
MEVTYSIVLHPSVVKEDIPKLDKAWRKKIRDSVHSKLTIAPELFGVPLRQTLSGLRKLRVGDYRVIYKIEKKIVQILVIKHRSVVYKEILKRI